MKPRISNNLVFAISQVHLAQFSFDRKKRQLVSGNFSWASSKGSGVVPLMTGSTKELYSRSYRNSERVSLTADVCKRRLWKKWKRRIRINNQSLLTSRSSMRTPQLLLSRAMTNLDPIIFADVRVPLQIASTNPDRILTADTRKEACAALPRSA